MTTIKSVTPVQAYGNGNNGNWLARVRLADNQEFFAGHGAGYSLAQAQALINNNRVHAGVEFENPNMLHPITREEMGRVFEPLAAGVKIKA
jgi:hypothetical protein